MIGGAKGSLIKELDDQQGSRGSPIAIMKFAGKPGWRPTQKRFSLGLGIGQSVSAFSLAS